MGRSTSKLTKKEQPKHDDKFYQCMECSWSGDVSECEFDTDYDEFNYRHYKYPYCPKCSGAVQN